MQNLGKREAILMQATHDLSMEDIRQKVLVVFRNVSRNMPPQKYKVTFELDWDPLSFVEEQHFSGRPDVALESAITLTGSEKDAQATTAWAYLAQTWPATGEYVMQLVADIVRSNAGDHGCKYNFPDGTEIKARIHKGKKFIVTAVGSGDSLAEIGQQFAWLGAALRSSPFGTGIAACSPFIQSIHLKKTVSQAQAASQPVLPVEITFMIDFEMAKPAEREEAPGWHNLFRNPVMVNGYPIPIKYGYGLEMPLDMMARLIGAERATEEDGKVFLEGVSMMSMAVKRIVVNGEARALIIWHYFYDSEGGVVSYLDSLEYLPEDVDHISLPQLETARHVVGWCTELLEPDW
jgi:hypothetical protein